MSHLRYGGKPQIQIRTQNFPIVVVSSDNCQLWPKQSTVGNTKYIIAVVDPKEYRIDANDVRETLSTNSTHLCMNYDAIFINNFRMSQTCAMCAYYIETEGYWIQ